MDIFLNKFSCDAGTCTLLCLPLMAAEFTVGLSVGPDVDISSPDGIQAAYSTTAIEIKIATGAVVQIATGQDDVAEDRAKARAATTLELLDFEVIAYNSFGGTVTLIQYCLILRR